MESISIVSKREVGRGAYITYNKALMHFPNGNEAEWDLIHHNGAAAMVAFDADGRIVMIRQYRPGEDCEILEIPAGGINPGEEPRTAAIREMTEETGAVCADVKHLIDVMPSPAYNDEKVTVYYGRVASYTNVMPDENEFVTIERYELSELIQKIMQGEIRDSKTIAALFAFREVLLGTAD